MTYNKYYLMILYHLIFKFDYFLKKFDKFKYLIFIYDEKKLINIFAFNERINNSFSKNIDAIFIICHIFY